MYQQVENGAVRGCLQGLVAKLEAHLFQQNRTVEKEHWTIQQDSVRVKAQQVAFREELVSELNRLEENRESLQKSRDQFLAEQQAILTRCFDEQSAIALQRENVARLERKAGERDMVSRQMSEQVCIEVVVVFGVCILFVCYCCVVILLYLKMKPVGGTFFLLSVLVVGVITFIREYVSTLGLPHVNGRQQTPSPPLS